MIIEDDGALITTTQTFTADSGETVRLVWRGECDGKEHPVEGALTPFQLSCRRSASGALVNTIVSGAGSYVETCVLESKVRMRMRSSSAGAWPRASAWCSILPRYKRTSLFSA